MPTNSSVTELEIVIPKDKLNDLEFIYLKLMEVSLDTLDQISKHSEKNFLDLVNEFLPELKNLDNDEFLSKWSLSKTILNGTQVENITNIIEDKPKEPVISENNPPEKKTPVKKKKFKLPNKPKKIKLPKKTKINTVQKPGGKNDTNSNTIESTAKITKPKKIKLVKKKLKLSKKA
tara:strand:- start:4 stop:531 length:528 start_codon:yes stop_codon:yes gene_type:complete